MLHVINKATFAFQSAMYQMRSRPASRPAASAGPLRCPNYKTGFTKNWKSCEVSIVTFFKVCHHPGGSFIYWANVTSLTCKADVQSDISHMNRNCVNKSKEEGLINRDSTVKVLCRHWDSNRDLPTQVLGFAAAPPLQDLAIFMALRGRAPFKWPVLCGTTWIMNDLYSPDDLPIYFSCNCFSSWLMPI